MTQARPTSAPAGDSPEDLPPLRPPSAHGGLLEVFRRRYLLRLLVRREINARYSGSLLGIFWSYIQPAARLAMYYFVIGVVLDRGVENFAIHVFAGLVMVTYMNETFNAGTRSILGNKGLVRKMAMPREMFPVASMLVSAYHVVPGLILLSAICVALGWVPDPVGIAAGLLGFVLATTLGTAVALLLSAANVFFRDISNVVQTLTMFTTFSVPMIYPFSLVDERFGDKADLYLLNPLASVVLLFQRAFWVGTTDDPSATIASDMPEHLFTRGFIILGVALLLLVVAQWVFSRVENKIPEML